MSTSAIAHGRVDSHARHAANDLGSLNLGDIAIKRLGQELGYTGAATKRVITRKIRKSVSNTAHLPWQNVSLRQELAASSHLGKIKPPPAYVWGLVAAAVLFHSGIAWYINTHSNARVVKPHPAEVALQFERPKPPEPKIEPPKPEPQRQQPKQAQVLPPIQTAAPQPSDAPAAPSAEPPVAVAPIVSAPPAPEPPPAPVTAPIGRAGYLNNPPPEYPAIAVRQGWQGTVILRVHVQANGKPDLVEVQKSSGRKVLDDEAVRTVKGFWSYTPAKRGDTPIEGWTTTPIEFQIGE